MESERKFRNIKKVQRNREIEGTIGAELGFEDGVKLWVLCQSDANPRWVQFGDDYSAELRRLINAKASPERQKRFFDEWLPRIFVLRWEDVFDEDDQPIPFSLEECQRYFRQSDDAYQFVLDMIRDTKYFRGARVEASKATLGNA